MYRFRVRKKWPPRRIYNEIPSGTQGIYRIYDLQKHLIYIGTSQDIRNRIRAHVYKRKSGCIGRRGHWFDFESVSGDYSLRRVEKMELLMAACRDEQISPKGLCNVQLPKGARECLESRGIPIRRPRRRHRRKSQ